MGRSITMPSGFGVIPKAVHLHEYPDHYILTADGKPVVRIERNDGFTIPDGLTTIEGVTDYMMANGVRGCKIEEADNAD